MQHEEEIDDLDETGEGSTPADAPVEKPERTLLEALRGSADEGDEEVTDEEREQLEVLCVRFRKTINKHFSLHTHPAEIGRAMTATPVAEPVKTIRSSSASIRGAMDTHALGGEARETLLVISSPSHPRRWFASERCVIE